MNETSLIFQDIWPASSVARMDEATGLFLQVADVTEPVNT